MAAKGAAGWLKGRYCVDAVHLVLMTAECPSADSS